MKLRPTLALLSLALAAFIAPLAAPAFAQDPEPAAAQPEGPAPGVDAESTAGGAEAPPVAVSTEQAQPGFMGSVDRAMGSVNGVISAVFFYDVLFWDDEHQLPLVVLWLVLGAIFFTIRMGFINFRGFGHAIQVVRGKYSDPNDAGEVSHFQALSAALSATVGLGNIAGVAIAVSVGGPGATFWMIVAGLLGMSKVVSEDAVRRALKAMDDIAQARLGNVSLQSGLVDRVDLGHPRHAQVQPGSHGCHRVVDRPPVGHHHAVVAPFALEHVAEQAVMAVDLPALPAGERSHDHLHAGTLLDQGAAQFSRLYDRVHDKVPVGRTRGLPAMPEQNAAVPIDDRHP